MNIHDKYNHIIIIKLIIYNYYKNNLNLNLNLKKIYNYNVNNIINFFYMLYKNIDKENKYFNLIYNNLINIIKFGSKNNCLNSYLKKKFFTIINFPNTNNVDLNKIKIHNDSYFYVTNYYDSNFINNIIFKKFKTKNLIITDATSHIGGNTLSFGLFKFKLINSIEVNYNYFKFLINNINCYNLKNIKLINENYINIYKKITQDIVFIDPPWGGPSYKKIKNLNLYLDKINIVDLIYNLFKFTNTKAVVIKVPYNYNVYELKKKNNKLIIKYFYLKKFQIIILSIF